MSFIDMMANHRWSEADIVNRTEAIIASEFPPVEVEIINRIVTAAAAGIYQLTEEEETKVNYYNVVCLLAREEGEAARADMALLAQALDYEDAQHIKAAALASIARAQVAIVDAQPVLDAAGAGVLALVEQRRPSEPVPEPAPEFPTQTEEVNQ